MAKGLYRYIFHNTLLCIVDYYSKFSVMRDDVLSADDLIRAAKIMCEEFRLPKWCHRQA